MIALLGGVCQLCGYSRCSRSLVFHHINPEDKGFDFTSGAYMKSWADIKQELTKCLLLCSNCHGEVHAGLVDEGRLAQLVEHSPDKTVVPGSIPGTPTT